MNSWRTRANHGCKGFEHGHEITRNLENVLNWFYANGMVVNPNKFQLMFLGLHEEQKLRLNIVAEKISSTEHIKLLGIEIDSQLRFNMHVKTLCDKTNRKVSAFTQWRSQTKVRV